MLEVIIPDKVKPIFYKHIDDTYLYFIGGFDSLPFAFREGVYTDFLRSRGIIIEVRMYPYYHEVDRFQPIVVQRHGLTTTLEYTVEYNTALILALNEGFKLLEEQIFKL